MNSHSREDEWTRPGTRRHAQARAARVPPASRRTRPCPVSRAPSGAGPGGGVAARRALSRSLWPAHLPRSATARGLGRTVRFPRTPPPPRPPVLNGHVSSLPPVLTGRVSIAGRREKCLPGGGERGNGARHPGVASHLRAQSWSGRAPGMPSRRETRGRTSQCAPAPPTPTCPAYPPWSSPRALHAVRDATCPLSTRGGTRLVRSVRGRGGGCMRTALSAQSRLRGSAHPRRPPQPRCTAPHRVLLVPGERRSVSD